jgi:hypothetical protein
VSEGKRCDGCKDMIAEEGEAYLELKVRARPDPEDTYYRDREDAKHFHARACLSVFVDRVGWWDGSFGEEVLGNPLISDREPG